MDQLGQRLAAVLLRVLGVSSRRVGLPMSFQSFFPFSRTDAGGESCCAASASCPYEAREVR